MQGHRLTRDTLFDPKSPNDYHRNRVNYGRANAYNCVYMTIGMYGKLHSAANKTIELFSIVHTETYVHLFRFSHYSVSFSRSRSIFVCAYDLLSYAHRAVCVHLFCIQSAPWSTCCNMFVHFSPYTRTT